MLPAQNPVSSTTTEFFPQAEPAPARHPVVVLGASGALGSRLARGLAQHYPVTLAVRDRSRLPDDLAGLPCEVIDIRDGTSMAKALASASYPTGALTGVVNAAGVVAFGGFGSVPAAVAAEVMTTNALGVVNMLAAAPLIVDGGFVVNLSGVAAEAALANMGVYCASKAAASAAMRVAARELRRRQIRAIDVRVGHTETGLAARPLFGAPPALPAGLAPDAVAARIIAAITGGETDLPTGAFTVLPTSGPAAPPAHPAAV